MAQRVRMPGPPICPGLPRILGAIHYYLCLQELDRLSIIAVSVTIVADIMPTLA